MADNTGVVILETDPPLELKLGHRALKTFCARTRLGVDELATVLQRYDIMALLIAVMVQTRYPDMTEERIDEILDGLPLEEVIQKASEAVYGAFPSQAAAEAPDGDQGPFAPATSGPTA